MALRRPPTRIELKADDVEEYDKIMKERQSLAEQEAMKGQTGNKNTPSNHKWSFSSGISPMSSQKKPSAAERIGYTAPR